MDAAGHRKRPARETHVVLVAEESGDGASHQQEEKKAAKAALARTTHVVSDV